MGKSNTKMDSLVDFVDIYILRKGDWEPSVSCNASIWQVSLRDDLGLSSSTYAMAAHWCDCGSRMKELRHFSDLKTLRNNGYQEKT